MCVRSYFAARGAILSAQGLSARVWVWCGPMEYRLRVLVGAVTQYLERGYRGPPGLGLFPLR